MNAQQERLRENQNQRKAKSMQDSEKPKDGVKRGGNTKVHPGAMLLNNSCLALITLFVVRISASWVISRAYHLDTEMHGFEIRIDHTFILTVCDFHHMVVMCYCHIDRMAAMGMCFDHVDVMGIGKCCHIVGVGCGMMVVHILEFVVHVVFVVHPRRYSFPNMLEKFPFLNIPNKMDWFNVG
nr:putative methyltransferase PMT23 [Tanacetum cinerariifolium]